MSEWIEHDGKDCPVSTDTIVDARMRDGTIVPETEAGFWGGRTGTNRIFNGPDWWLWEEDPHNGHDNDIVAYRLLSPEADQIERRKM